MKKIVTAIIFLCVSLCYHFTVIMAVAFGRKFRMNLDCGAEPGPFIIKFIDGGRGAIALELTSDSGNAGGLNQN